MPNIIHKIVRRLRSFILIDVLGIQHWMTNYYQQLFYQISTDLRLPGNLMTYEDMHKSLGHCEKTSIFYKPDILTCPSKVFLYEDVYIYGCSKFIISPKGEFGKFIMKKHSGASQGLTVISGKHGHEPGRWSKTIMNSREKDIDKDIIVEEDVSIGANVTLLSGITIGRGSIVGACSVVTKDVPPYSIVAGNPAKVIAYKFTPEQVQKHEELLYPVEDRIDLNIVRSHYDDFHHHRQL